MKILLVHAWLTGNLGDLLQTYVLMRHLKTLAPAKLDIAGYPRRPVECSRLITSLANDVFYDEPAPEKLPIIGKRWRPIWQNRRNGSRARMYANYDVIISAPGPFLTVHDERLQTVLLDLNVANSLGLPFILSSHSIGPISHQHSDELKKASLVVSREPETYKHLESLGLSSVNSADFAFTFPFHDFILSTNNNIKKTCLLFLRSNNFDNKQIFIQNDIIKFGENEIYKSDYDEIILATSDQKKDHKFMQLISKKLDVEMIICKTIEQLVTTINNSYIVISDRYHPIICAASLGKKTKIIMSQNSHKMKGLNILLSNHTIEYVKTMSRKGLDHIHSFILSK